VSRVEFTQRALDELDAAAAWYRKRNAALEQRFLAAAREAADRIEANPLANQVVLDGDIRRANFPRRWPWSLFYVVNPDRSIVIGALHGRQHLRRLRGRLPG
jgi:plasmid stabilization system protein ParE